jgi:hypothetical protein
LLGLPVGVEQREHERIGGAEEDRLVLAIEDRLRGVERSLADEPRSEMYAPDAGLKTCALSSPESSACIASPDPIARASTWIGRPDPREVAEASNFFTCSSIHVFFSLPKASTMVTGVFDPVAPDADGRCSAALATAAEGEPSRGFDSLDSDRHPKRPRRHPKITARRRLMCFEASQARVTSW